MDATCAIQDSIHVFNLVHKYVSRILGTYHRMDGSFFDGQKMYHASLCNGDRHLQSLFS